MKILVTGAAGFLGGHVVRRLLCDGHEVTTFDILHVELPNCRHIVGDLRHETSVQYAVAGQDLICHLGGIGDVYVAEQAPTHAAEVNISGAENVARAAHLYGARVVFASSWEVYGTPHYQPIDESHPCSPQHPYSISKLAAERALFHAHQHLGVSVVSLRLGTAFGRGLRPNSVFRVFQLQASQGGPIVVHGDGSQTRQFIHTSDVAEAFSLACGSSVSGSALNIASSRSISVRELAEYFACRFGVGIRFGGKRPGDAPSARLTSARAGQALGWRPTVSFEEGMEDLTSNSATNWGQ